jgi:hypothetical protein
VSASFLCSVGVVCCVPCCCRGRDAAALQGSIDEVNRALLRHGLPFGAKAAEPQELTAYPFSHDPGVSLRLTGGRNMHLYRSVSACAMALWSCMLVLHSYPSEICL